MTRHFRPPSLHQLWMAALCACVWHGAAAADLSVCVDKTNPAAAMDRKLADAVAKQDRLTLVIHEFDGSGDDDGFNLKNFAKLLASQCQLVLGFPVDATSGGLPPNVQATEAYARIGFVLVTPTAIKAEDLAALPNGTDVAVTYMTTPNLYFAAHPNVNADVHETDDETLKTVIDHKARAAMIWRPTLVRYEQTHPTATKLVLHELNEPHARWNVVALYGPAGAQAATAFNDGVDRLRSAGQLDATIAPYGAATAAPVIKVAANEAAAPAAALPALYTADQASAGHTKFLANCAVCHGKDLTGMAGPALKGTNFASDKAAFHVGDVFTIVTQNMPATNPGSLEHADYEQIMAFILKQNGYPAGGTPLAYTDAMKSTVPLRYHGQ